MVTNVDQELERLLEYLRDNRGFDFTGYKRASLTRRIRKRMREIGIEDFASYQDHLEVHPEEFTHLFNTILINVTSFFRDPSAWEYLEREIVPQIAERTAPSRPVRMWSVGCASGQEAYTLAMVVAEALALDPIGDRVKIYATDVDEHALAQARSGVYSETEVASIPAGLREKYLEERGSSVAFRKDLRRAVIFGRHDLVNDAPIARVDLITCRNTLMYFNSDTQSKIYNGFHFALNPGGLLFLGKSEMLLTRTNIFMPVDLKQRVFVRVPSPDLDRHRIAPIAQGDRAQALRAAVFEGSAGAQLVVDSGDTLVAANSHARSLFGLTEYDFGRPFHELEVSHHPIELRSRIDHALTERRPVREPGVAWTSRSGDPHFFDVHVVPLTDRDEVIGVDITFVDVTRAQEMHAELERSRRELETAYEEIQSTVEELETTNEELQSTNEELETTNEELQSTNEELETMNEELHSTNEELETINTELHERTRQLNQTNAFLETILESLRTGVVVVDRELTIESWNALAEDLWGLRAQEVRGRNLLTLDIGLPVGELRTSALEVLEGERDRAQVVLDATNRTGRAIRCKVDLLPLRDGDSREGAILLMEPLD